MRLFTSDAKQFYLISQLTGLGAVSIHCGCNVCSHSFPLVVTLNSKSRAEVPHALLHCLILVILNQHVFKSWGTPWKFQRVIYHCSVHSFEGKTNMF